MKVFRQDFPVTNIDALIFLAGDEFEVVYRSPELPYYAVGPVFLFFEGNPKCYRSINNGPREEIDFSLFLRLLSVNRWRSDQDKAEFKAEYYCVKNHLNINLFCEL